MAKSKRKGTNSLLVVLPVILLYIFESEFTIVLYAVTLTDFRFLGNFCS
jgi:hypothetical protein